VFSKVGEFFSGIGTKIGDAVAGAAKSAINWVLEKAIGIINGFISGINFAIGIINKIPGVEITKLSALEVPKFARGGVVDRPTLAVVGEAGQEAVMPLERNTGWIDKLADKLADKIGGGGGNIDLTVKLGEDTIFEKFIEYGRSKAFETNGEVVFA
jgi:phage-related protein